MPASKSKTTNVGSRLVILDSLLKRTFYIRTGSFQDLETSPFHSLTPRSPRARTLSSRAHCTGSCAQPSTGFARTPQVMHNSRCNFETRDAILHQWTEETPNPSTGGNPPRVVCAIILAVSGRRDEARSFLTAQARENINHPHFAWVLALADKLELGELDL